MNTFCMRHNVKCTTRNGNPDGATRYAHSEYDYENYVRLKSCLRHKKMLTIMSDDEDIVAKYFVKTQRC